MIYEAIRQCADLATLKADPEVQRLLRSEMKGHDLWRAQLLLEFGKETAFPVVVKDIWAATKGAPTTSSRTNRTRSSRSTPSPASTRCGRAGRASSWSRSFGGEASGQAPHKGTWQRFGAGREPVNHVSAERRFVLAYGPVAGIRQSEWAIEQMPAAPTWAKLGPSGQPAAGGDECATVPTGRRPGAFSRIVASQSPPLPCM